MTLLFAVIISADLISAGDQSGCACLSGATPPAFLTTCDFSMRSLTPRRQSTTLPVTFAESSVPGWHSAALAAVAPAAALLAASTTCVGVVSAPVTDAPVMSNGAPLDGVMC